MLEVCRNCPIRKEAKKEPTVREMQILELVAAGEANKEIGNQLHISEQTVKNHLSSLFVKYKVKNRVHLITFALNNGIIKIKKGEK